MAKLGNQQLAEIHHKIYSISKDMLQYVRDAKENYSEERERQHEAYLIAI